MNRRILLIAEAANPEWASVPLVGWSLARAIQKREPGAHIVTQIRNREAFLRAGLREGEDFTAIDSEKIAGPAHRLIEAVTGGKGVAWTLNTAVRTLTYPYFEKLVWERFGDAIGGQEGYALVHRITPLTPTAPSPIAPKAAARGAKFVMGPLNGGVPWPKSFGAARRAEKEWLSYIRGAYKLLPGRGDTLDHAAAILCGSRYTLSEIPARHQDKAVWIPENAIDPERFHLTAPAYEGGPPKVVFVGRLVPYKGPDMLLEAAAPLIRAGKAEVSIVGDGPMMADLQSLTAGLGIEAGVTLHGQVPHKDVQERFAEAHILGFPSVREFGGGVVLEAMALGVVPLIADYAGPGELVDDAVGFKVPMTPRGELIASFRKALERLAAEPSLLAPRRAAAMARVRERFTWDAKAAAVSAIYDQVLAGAPPL